MSLICIFWMCSLCVCALKSLAQACLHVKPRPVVGKHSKMPWRSTILARLRQTIKAIVPGFVRCVGDGMGRCSVTLSTSKEG